MYAVVKTGGKQLRVEPGGSAVIEKLDAPVGEKVTLPVLFVADGEQVTFDAAGLEKVTVTAEVVEHFKGRKVTVFKFKKRKGYKRTKGHRQDQTRVRIVDIATGAAKPKRATRKKAEKAPEEPVATETAPESAE